jgi:ORF6N domain
MPKKSSSLIPVERFASRIYLLRGKQVMFDFGLADLYSVGTKVLNQAVTRNPARFPDDFIFRLTPEEMAALNRSQIVTGSKKHRAPKFPPRAFTQAGVAMLSGVLRSPPGYRDQSRHHASHPSSAGCRVPRVSRFSGPWGAARLSRAPDTVRLHQSTAFRTPPRPHFDASHGG